MKKIIYASLASVLMLTTLNACKKEGCTDSFATNYDEKADSDNGTCTYTGTVQFWYGKSASDWLDTVEVTSLAYYVDNQLIGSSAANVYFTGDPSCTQANVVRKTMDLGLAKTKTVPYKVVDQNSDIIWSGNATFDGTKSCINIQLTK
ncbi:MAG: hypothetical protein ACK5CV_09325 [Bacteroidota bacterium]|jgi:hypothetical protein